MLCAHTFFLYVHVLLLLTLSACAEGLHTVLTFLSDYHLETDAAITLEICTYLKYTKFY